MKIALSAALAAALIGVAGQSADATGMTQAEAAAVLAVTPGATVSRPPAEVVTPAHGRIPAPPPGQGQIVFYRNSALYGLLIGYAVKENGRKLGNLSNGAYFVLPVDPGEHVFTAATENKDTLRLEVDAGETYFVRGTVYLGLVLGEASIFPSDEASFEQVYHNLHRAKTWPANFSVADSGGAPDATP